jgi:hypothetical protein
VKNPGKQQRRFRFPNPEGRSSAKSITSSSTAKPSFESLTRGQAPTTPRITPVGGDGVPSPTIGSDVNATQTVFTEQQEGGGKDGGGAGDILTETGGAGKINLLGAEGAEQLTSAELEERYGALGTMGTVFTGELETKLGQLDVWSDEGSADFDIWEGRGPLSLGEAYRGLQQGTISDANKVRAVQVLDQMTAVQMSTDVGSTVYFGYVDGKFGRLNHDTHVKLIDDYHTLLEFRPQAMELIQRHLNMADEITLQAHEDAYARARDKAERVFKIGAADLKQRHEAELAKATAKVTGAEARATARVTGQEARATLAMKHKQEDLAAVAQHQRDLNIMEATLHNETEILKASTAATQFLDGIQWELEMVKQEHQQEFAFNQAALDRALQVADMTLAANLQTQANILQAEEIEVQRQQQQMDWLMSLVTNPTALYMMKVSGLLGNIENIGGQDVSGAVDKILAATPEQAMKNIQGFNASSTFKNRLDSFNASLNRGLSATEFESYVASTAPYTRGTTSRMEPGQATNWEAYFGGPTTEADIAGPSTADTFGYEPPARSALEDVQRRGQQILYGVNPANAPRAFDMTGQGVSHMPYLDRTISDQRVFEVPSDQSGGPSVGQEEPTTEAQRFTGANILSSDNPYYHSENPTMREFARYAPDQIVANSPNITNHQAEMMVNNAMQVAIAAPNVETPEAKAKFAWEIISAWAGPDELGVYAVSGKWYDRGVELTPNTGRQAGRVRQGYRNA